MSETGSLYIHVPFCIRKCGYCDFYSIEDQDLIPALVKALAGEIRLRTGISGKEGSDPEKSLEISTLYFGGGTPSLLPVRAVESILETVHAAYQVRDGVEITFEVNPGTLDASYLADLRRLGINRLSMGAQSFDGGKLEFLTRIHTVEDSLKAIEQARKAGFENMGLDLIYGLPGESPADWEKDLETAVRFDPAHLSCYMLTIEPGTPLYSLAEKKQFTPCSPEARARLFLKTSELLEQKGYIHYEISNFSRGPGNRSRHNSNYWNMTDYQGLGPSAHSFERPDHGDPQRSWNVSEVNTYIRMVEACLLPLEDREILTPAQQKLERIMLGLRTREGIDIPCFNRDFKEDFCTKFEKIIPRLEDQGLGKFTDQKPSGEKFGNLHFRLTRDGWTRLDSIVETFADRIL